jgi:nucleoside-diphosphate-sugar epimerase
VAFYDSLLARKWQNLVKIGLASDRHQHLDFERDLMSKSVLLIGGAGYIGPVIAEHLLSKDYEVTILDKLIYENAFSTKHLDHNSGFNFILGDMGSGADLAKAIQGKDNVVILAGLVGDPITKKYPEKSKNINNDALQFCIGFLSKQSLSRTIFVSTCSNYGLITGDSIADENYPLKPLSLYAESKVAAEEFILSMNHLSNFSPTILRFATAFGLAPRMRFDLTINEFTRDLALGKVLNVFDPDTWRPYCHVRDFAKIIELVLEAPESAVRNQTFNAGSEINNFTKRQVIEIISKHIPKSSISYQEQSADPRNYRVNFDKLQTVLGFRPGITVEMGVLEIIQAIADGKYGPTESVMKYGNYELGAK